MKVRKWLRFCIYIGIVIDLYLTLPYLFSKLNVSGSFTTLPLVALTLPLYTALLIFIKFKEDISLPKQVLAYPWIALLAYLVPYTNNVFLQMIHTLGLFIMLIACLHYLIQYDRRKRLALMCVLPLILLSTSVTNNINFASQYIFVFLFIYLTY